jgi:outer membrane protein assembly factor BamB
MSTSQATRGFFRVLLSALFVVNLGACSWVKGLWDGDDEDKELEPVPLVDIESEIKVREVWSTGIGNGQGKFYNRLQIALSGGAIYAASANGSVESVDAQSG